MDFFYYFIIPCMFSYARRMFTECDLDLCCVHVTPFESKSAPLLILWSLLCSETNCFQSKLAAWDSEVEISRFYTSLVFCSEKQKKTNLL